jgi:MFS transporter, MHS family, proline/betaine transporter
MSDVTSAAQARKAVVAATLGNILEWYDFGIYGILAGVIAANFFPKDDANAALLAVFAVFGVGFVFRPLGGILIGRYGDTHGRKAALVLTILLMAGSTLVIGLLPTYATVGVWAPILLLIARMVQGFSTGGEWGGATAFMVEWSPPNQRGWYGSFQQMSVALGGLLANGVAALLTTALAPEDLNGWGWRVAFIIGGLFGPIGQFLRRRVDETPPYRDAEAHGGAAATPPNRWTLAALAFGFTVHWTVCYYTFLTYMPTYTRVQAHLSPALSLWSNTIALFALVFLVPAMGALSDRVGRKPLLLLSCAAFILLPLPMLSWMVGGAGFGFIALMQVVFAIAIALFSGPGPAAIAEMFPTRGRSTWMSSSYALAVAIFGGFSPFVSQWLIGATGWSLAPTIWVAAAGLVSFIVIARLRETAFRPLA